MQLLVSVVVAEEVAAAVQGGADIIDVKNPAEGAFGASVPEVVRQVRRATPADRPVSATLGDLPYLPGTAALAALGAATCGVQFVKAGLFGSQRVDDAVVLLRQVCRAVRDPVLAACAGRPCWPQGQCRASAGQCAPPLARFASPEDPAIRVIACGYADADLVGALPPADLPAAAAQAGADGCLLDTYRKGQGTLLTLLTDRQLAHFVAQCRQFNLLCALAGSLSAADLPRVCGYRPDIVGVRTAACQGDRVHGRVAADKVRHLKSLLSDSASR